MKKLTKMYLRKKLDKIVSEIIRKRGLCEKCGSSKNLHTAHIFSRSYLSVRWDLDNCLCLCCKCHLYWAHLNPIEFVEFVKVLLGDKYEALKEKFREITKLSEADLELKLIALQEIRKEMDEKHISDWRHA